MRLLALVWPRLREPDADACPFERMLDALDDLSPRIEAVDVGVALVDVTGLTTLWGPERRVAARAVMLVRTVAPLAVLLSRKLRSPPSLPTALPRESITDPMMPPSGSRTTTTRVTAGGWPSIWTPVRVARLVFCPARLRTTSLS